MEEKLITSNPEQTLKITWDGERFSFIELGRKISKVIILNPREAREVQKFILCFSKRSE